MPGRSLLLGLAASGLVAIGVCGACKSTPEEEPACTADLLLAGAQCKCGEEGKPCSSGAECCTRRCDYATKKCATRSPCNPVTNSPCSANAREICFEDKGAFDCEPRFVSPVALCAECTNNALACPGGTVCAGSPATCAKACCSDDDCGTGFCKPIAGIKDYGGCFDKTSGRAACDAPLTSPSGGSCLTTK